MILVFVTGVHPLAKLSVVAVVVVEGRVKNKTLSVADAAVAFQSEVVVVEVTLDGEEAPGTTLETVVKSASKCADVASDSGGGGDAILNADVFRFGSSVVCAGPAGGATTVGTYTTVTILDDRVGPISVGGNAVGGNGVASCNPVEVSDAILRATTVDVVSLLATGMYRPRRPKRVSKRV